MSTFMNRYLIVIAILLGIMIFLSLIYAVLGRRFTDKIVASNMIGSLGVNIIVLIAVFQGKDYILDVGLIFAMLSFLTVIILCRFVQNRVQIARKREKKKEVRE
ncbi:MAG: sodium:proton antiporter [Firmicutes bacterium]|nr:sodium:proton antiporter [Bacillota bacterium]MCR4712573.1 sodium:proton antiporter [Clostridia bacterium]